MEPQAVEVVQLSGEALDWLRLGLVAIVSLFVVQLVVVTAAVVVHLWRGA